MPNYRRIQIPNAFYFFTVVTYQRQTILTSEYARACLHHAFQHVRKRWAFDIEAIVLLPDHLHAIWKLPDGDADYSTRWRLIKDKFTQEMKNRVSSNVELSNTRKAKKEQAVWERRFWEHHIRGEQDFERHLHYIHYNPVKHGYAQSPKDWKWSSFHRYVKMGWYDEGWGAVEPNDLMDTCAGE